MEHRIKRDEYLLNLITDFENNLSVGAQSYFSEKAFSAIIAYYESESMLVNALEVIDLAQTQFPYRAEFLIAKSRVLLNMNKAKKALNLQLRDEASWVQILTAAEAPFAARLSYHGMVT